MRRTNYEAPHYVGSTLTILLSLPVASAQHPDLRHPQYIHDLIATDIVAFWDITQRGMAGSYLRLGGKMASVFRR
jgi:hypothetical protein